MKPPAWYWIVAGLATLWMLFGVLAWTMDLMMDPAALADMSEGQRELYTTRPGWVFIAYGVAIFCGLAGSIGLLLRRSWAVTAFGISLVAVIIQFGYVFIGMKAIETLGAAEAVPFPALIFAIGAFLLWFATRARQRGWLRH